MVNLNWDHFAPIPALEQDAKASAERLYLDLKEAFPGFVADFEQKFTTWQQKWFSSDGMGSSAMHCCELPEYDPLLFLGPKTVPLVVFELTKPENFFATALYNHLETDPQAKVDPHDVLNYLTLNRHANLIVELNHERWQRAKACIEAWKTRIHSLQEGEEVDITSCEEYDALIDMGPSIVGLVMLEYSRDRAGPWHKVMYHLVCGKRMMGLGDGEEEEADGQGQYERWRDWFEYLEHHEAEEGLTPGYLSNCGTWSW